ncbi:MAG: HD domain-containing protein [Candidatus Aminicenantes bacterium]|nr:HD domain-containing protein [Candidatus Aminicenantes bacterium]
MRKNLHILILEDEPADRKLIERELKKGNFTFVTKNVEKKQEFLKELKEFNPDIILADYNLPSYNGMAALKSARKMNSGIPFIFVSGAIGEEFAIETLKQGATDYVLKQKLSRLVPAVKRALQEDEERKKRHLAEEELKNSYALLRKVFEETIGALVSALEKRDPYTAGHQRRVAHLARAIAVEWNQPDEKIEGTYFAARLHDIGKINIPSDILTKPNHLPPQEKALIETHPQVGYEILKEIHFPWPIARIVLQHHERMDGTGYPSGIKGKNIIIEARILGVADVVEAMASDRPYRSSLGIKKALEEISKNKGILYDTNAANICLNLFREKGYTLGKPS